MDRFQLPHSVVVLVVDIVIVVFFPFFSFLSTSFPGASLFFYVILLLPLLSHVVSFFLFFSLSFPGFVPAFPPFSRTLTTQILAKSAHHTTTKQPDSLPHSLPGSFYLSGSLSTNTSTRQQLSSLLHFSTPSQSASQPLPASHSHCQSATVSHSQMESIESLKAANLKLGEDNFRLREGIEREKELELKMNSLLLGESTLKVLETLSPSDLVNRLQEALSLYTMERDRKLKLEEQLRYFTLQVAHGQKLKQQLDQMEVDYKEQSEVLGHWQGEVQKMALYKQTAEKQEKVISTLEGVLEKSLKEVQEAQGLYLEVERLQGENYNLRERVKGLIERKSQEDAAKETILVLQSQLEAKDKEIARLVKLVEISKHTNSANYSAAAAAASPTTMTMTTTAVDKKNATALLEELMQEVLKSKKSTTRFVNIPINQNENNNTDANTAHMTSAPSPTTNTSTNHPNNHDNNNSNSNDNNRSGNGNSNGNEESLVKEINRLNMEKDRAVLEFERMQTRVKALETEIKTSTREMIRNELQAL